MRVFAAAVVAVAVPLAAASAPSSLTADFLGSGAEQQPALGVRLRPSFGWVVPPCAGSKDAMQTAYSLAVYRDGEPGTPLWRSGKVQSNASVAVPYGGPALDPGAAYEWTVQTWSGSSCASAASARATFVTALDAFRPSAKWIGVGEQDATFNLLRRVVAAPAGARRVLGFITAQNTDACMLFNYKLFINGTLASAGPGRGEAPVAGGDGVYRSLPYITLDLTEHFSAGGPTVIALQTMQFGANAPAVLMQVDVFSSSGGAEPAQSWVTEASSAWRVLDADPWLRPNNQVDAAGIPGWDGRDERRCPGARARSAGSTRIEFTDARKEPVGWRSDPLFDDRGWKDAVEIQSAALRPTELTPRMAGAAVEILSPIEPVRVAPVPNASRPNDSAFFLDFGKEIQGGLVLTVTGGSAGQVVSFRSGELCTPIVDGGSSSCVAVDQDWQWIFNWTLREGEQTIEQHQYQEWRYLSVVFEGSAPEHWSVSAWRVQAPWVADDSSFDSSSPMLNSVVELARYTLQAGVVDTYTDSNTRERRPYESDGLIAAANRHLLQRNTAMWARHSASWVLTFPTWPVEWSQMTPLLAHQDYMATGQTDLAEAYMDLLFNNTQIQWLDSATGLVNTTKPNARSDIFGLGAGRHLVGWAPSTGHAFAYSDFISTSNMYCARGLELLAELATAAGRTENATRFAGLAAALKRSIVEKMWDPQAERFCDGVCDDPKVAGKHSVYSDMYSLWLGMVPQPARPGVWRHVAHHGMTALGDYGVFVYLSALASDPAVDGGEAILTALTKCDNFSWCETMKLWDATMTRESLQVSLQHPTMSHAWGTSPVIGAVNGLLGLSQTSPGFGTFSVRPRLGGLAFAAAKVPTAHGPVVINATERSTEVHVPCNTLASLCAIAPPLEEQADVELALDGAVLHAESVRFEGHHACVDTLGCGEAGRARRVEWVTRLKLDDVQQQIAISLKPDVEFDGHGGLSAGGTSRLLIEYPEPQRSEILDFLFLPGFGAELGVLKLEIGGDTQSTDGTEPSHQHFRGDLGCKRGYEGWLASEAKKRNPDIRIWSLSWGVPGWIGNVSGNAPTFFCDDNIAYQVAWVKCLKDAWGVESDFLGLWNERPQGSVDYVIKLKQALTAAGFGRVGITAEATWQPFIRNALTDPQFAKAVVAGSVHYGCNESKNSEVAHNASMKWWAGEDTIGGVGPAPDGLARDGNWTGASCWGRKLSQHFLRMRATSTISWSVVWSAAPGVSSNGLAPAGKSHGFLGNGLLNATEPWSGHYHVPPTIWIMAHWHQFAKPGWRFLERGEAGGAGNLTAGGTYLTLVPPEGSSHPPNTFTLIVETLQGSCGPQGKCNVDAFDETQSLTFELKGPLAATKSLALWCSSVSAVFVKQPGVPVVRGTFSLAMRPDTICTATTLLLNGSKGVHPTPPPSARFPKRHSDDFSGSVQDTLPRGFSDVYGSFAVRPSKPGQMALTQVATAKPTGWAPTNLDPLTLIGDSMWADVTVNVTAIVNHSVDATNAPLLSTSTSRVRASDPPPPPVQPEYVRVCGGCGDTSKRGLSYGCLEGCCFRLAWSGNWSLGGEKTGIISDFKDTWHDIGIVIRDSAISATVDGSVLGSVSGSCPPQTSGFPGNGMVGLGCGSTPYHMCQFGSVDIEAGSGIGADPTTSAVSERFQRTPLTADEARLAVTTPSASFTSDVHIVMDWDRDHCGTINNTQLPPMPIPPCTVPSAAGCDVDNIDSMPRVWWDAKHGFYRQLHNVATVQGPSRPQIGDSLTTLKHTCRPYTKLQQEDNVLSHFSDHVWVEAPYVLNETHVYALTHVDSYNGVQTAGGNVYSDLTLQKSTDGGGSFAQAFPAPQHLVATSPYDNFRNGMLQKGLGLGMPSSIIKDPKSDYLYVMALANWGKSFSAQAGGQCLLRTNDITDPGSWRAWNGANFTVTVNASPAVAPVQNPDAHTCAVLDLPLRHISLLWSSYYSKFLAFGEIHQGVWAFALSDDLITWGPPTKIPSASLTWNLHGNATITPISPMPGRWTFAPKGSKYVQDVPIWIGAVNASGEKALSGDVYRWRAPCHTCSTMPCEPVPGMGDVCKLAKPIGLAEWSSIPAATVGFTAGLVSKLAGYVSYIYPTLVDDSEHKRTRSDPSLNVVGQTATVFFVANKCAGTDRNWKPGDGVPKCDITDAVRRDRRDVVRATIKFQKNEDPTSSAVSERFRRTPLKADEARLAVTRPPPPPPAPPGWRAARGALTQTPVLSRGTYTIADAAARCMSMRQHCGGFMVPWSNTSKSTAQLEVTFVATTNYDIYNTSMWAFTPPPPVFRFGNTLGDHAVLQQAPARAQIWGFARPGASVSVTSSAAAGTLTTRASKAGRWQVSLPPVVAMPSAVAASVTVSATSENATIVLSDLVYGDIWLCSGQSNMEFAVAAGFNASEEIRAADQFGKSLRLFTASQVASATPLDELQQITQGWARSSASVLAGVGSPFSRGFSAVCYFTGRRLAEERGISIGLIDASWGGSHIAHWVTANATQNCRGPVHHTKLGTTEEWEAPGDMFNAMVVPFTRTPIFGVLFYQGESDTAGESKASYQQSLDYACAFEAMIASWREHWHAQSDTVLEMPFGFVQLSVWGDRENNTCGDATTTADSDSCAVAVVRYGQTANHGFVPNDKLRNVFMAVTNDLGDPFSPFGDIHPRDKQQMAERLARSALAVAYHDPGTPFETTTGPLVVRAEAHGDKVFVSFNHTKRLVVRHAGGFELSSQPCDLGFPANSSAGWHAAPITDWSGVSVKVQDRTHAAPARCVRYNWWRSPCLPSVGTGNCAIYSSEEPSLPAPPFVAPVEAGAVETQALGAPG